MKKDKLKNLSIRKETPQDYALVEQLIEIAFQNEQHSDHKEHFLVKKLRKSEAFIPELSIVVQIEDKIVGHILLTKITIDNQWSSLALAPVSVLPEFQGQGIGGRLIKEAHKLAKDLGYGSVILLGHNDYYPRFGYKQLSQFGIKLPFEVPLEVCMAIELIPNSLKEVSGTVCYAQEFYQ